MSNELIDEIATVICCANYNSDPKGEKAAKQIAEKCRHAACVAVEKEIDCIIDGVSLYVITRAQKAINKKFKVEE